MTTHFKELSANDLGETGSHQAGIAVPKSNRELLAILPHLDPRIKNPDAWLLCCDEGGIVHQVRFIYYNNKLHSASGTRNEYRLTHLTTFLREQDAEVGDFFSIAAVPGPSPYLIRISKSLRSDSQPSPTFGRVRLVGWQKTTARF